MLFRTSRIDDQATMVPLSRDHFEYREGERRMHIVAELMASEPARVIYARSVRAWLPPHDSDPLTSQKREDIIARACRYFALNHQSFVVDQHG